MQEEENKEENKKEKGEEDIQELVIKEVKEE